MYIKRPAALFLTAYIFGVILAYDLVPTLCKCALGLIAIFLYLKLILEKRISIRVILVIALFLVFGYVRFRVEKGIFDRHAENVLSLGKGTKSITGKVASICKSINSNYLILTNCISGELDLGKARFYFDDDIKDKVNVKIGNLVKVDAGTSIIEGPSNEGEFNQENYYRSSGIVFIGFVKNIDIVNAKYDKLRQKIYEVKIAIRNQINKIFVPRDSGLFAAMLTGDRSGIDKDQKKLFSENGIAHIIAISGLHLSILGLAFFEFLRHFLSINSSSAIVSVFIFLYGIFIDASAASLRAITMLYVRFVSLAVGRTYDSKNTLYIVCFIFILMYPYLLFNAGFQFSYLAIFALNTEVMIGSGKKMKAPAIIVLTFFLFPITIYHYFSYPLYSILLNLIVIPLMPFVLGIGLLALITAFAYVPIGMLLGKIVHMIFLIYDNLCVMVKRLPYSILSIGRPTLYELLFYYVAIFLIIYSISNLYKVPSKKTQLRLKNAIRVKGTTSEKFDKILRNAKIYGSLNIIRTTLCIVLFIITILLISIRARSNLRMTFLSIGQGDSILIETNKSIMTIDGGSTSNASNGEYILAPHIKSRGINHIDYAFITHADSDHTNGIMYLLSGEDNIDISNIVLPINAMSDTKFDKLKKAADDSGVSVYYMKEKDIMTFDDDFKISVLSPDEISLSDKEMDQNELSLTFRLDYKNHSCLFTGDIGRRTMERMTIDEYDKNNMDVEVLKIPHHGSKNSNLKRFYDMVSPQYAVVSYGKNNNYGHPNEEVVKMIEDTGATVFKTGVSGQIDIYFDEEEIAYKVYK